MAEAGIHATFEMVAIVNGVKSREAGREVCDDKPHVRIRVAGNDKEEFFGPVRDEHKQRFPEAWEAFQKGCEVAKSGTPLERWGRITPSLNRHLKNMNCYTVEDVASISDIGLQKIGPGGNELRREAQKFLSVNQTAADVARLDDLTAENATLKAQLSELQRQVGALMAAQAPKEPEAAVSDGAEAVEVAPRRGRPRKAEAS